MAAQPGRPVVGMLDPLPSVLWFNNSQRHTFFPATLHLSSPIHVRKVVSSLEKQLCQYLNLSQMTYFRLFKTDRVCR